MIVYDIKIHWSQKVWHQAMAEVWK